MRHYSTPYWEQELSHLGMSDRILGCFFDYAAHDAILMQSIYIGCAFFLIAFIVFAKRPKFAWFADYNFDEDDV